ncbi:MAG: hypothetical protein JOZ39_08490 [Chloroflexi bacterium]|nr:hypothetical protein [Chloroflexota bacterium]
MAASLPPDFIREEDLFRFYLEHLGGGTGQALTRKDHLAFSLEQATDRARKAGRIRRWALKGPDGEVLGFGFKRDDLIQFCANNRSALDRD